ncbi:unnamed protein product [Lactuca saligna]|uniref:Uncharacterized protein n=1 Tax=Lactuca saligna TaxID=75948 RepID=A0AA35YYB3_LACSI|nr:unnamed protein product [Lactuca saligna]
MELKVVVDTKLAIKIDISSYNVTNKSNILGISRLTDNAAIIDELKKKESYSTGDNLTLCARGNSTATSPIKLISTPTELKRNLAICINLDEMENLSTSKSARLLAPEEKPMRLFIPKKEK